MLSKVCNVSLLSALSARAAVPLTHPTGPETWRWASQRILVTPSLTVWFSSRILKVFVPPTAPRTRCWFKCRFLASFCVCEIKISED